MTNWFTTVKNDLSKIDDAIEYYNGEFEEAIKETSLKGHLERNLRDLPGVVSYRFSQLQEIEAILEYLNNEANRLKKKFYKKYLENYQRALSSRDAEKYAEGEDEVVDMANLINDFALVRNKWLGLIKGLEAKNWTMGHITKLRTTGMEDIYL